MDKPTSFGLGTYVHVLSKLLRHPRTFFEEREKDAAAGQALYVLLISSLIFALASVISLMSASPLVMGAIYFVNAVGMAVLGSIITYGLTRLFVKMPTSYPKFFSLHAYAAGAVLIFSWMPYMLWLTEPVRWWLIGCGLVKSLGFTVKGAVALNIMTVGVVMALVWWAMVLIVPGI